MNATHPGARVPGVRPSPPASVEPAVVAALGALILAAAISKDGRLPFECDEMFTYYNTKAAGFPELWTLLSTGGFDASPPLYTLAAWQAQRLVRDDHLALRLPATIGVWMLSLCLYVFTRRRCPAPYAAMAMLALPMTAAFHWASVARPYGLMLGLLGVALVSWQAAAGGSRRPLAWIGLGASLAAAVATHYYAVLMLAPLGLAELTRTMTARRGRPDLPVWAAFVAGLIPLAVLHPLIANARRLNEGAKWLEVSRGLLLRTYEMHLLSFLPPVFAIAMLVLLIRPPIKASPTDEGGPEAPPSRYPPSEVVLIFGLVALPVMAYILGVAVTRAYSDRYVIPYLAGFGLLLSFASCRLLGGRRGLGIALAAIMFASFIYHARGSLARRDPHGPGDAAQYAAVAKYAARAAGDGRRLAILDGDVYTQYIYYLDKHLAAQLTLVDVNVPMHRAIYENLGRWCKAKQLYFDIRSLEDFLDNRDEYYVFGPLDRLYAAEDPSPLGIRLLAVEDGQAFYAVEPESRAQGATVTRRVATAAERP